MEAVGLRQQIDQGGQSRGASFPDAIIDESGHHLTLSYSNSRNFTRYFVTVGLAKIERRMAVALERIQS